MENISVTQFMKLLDNGKITLPKMWRELMDCKQGDIMYLSFDKQDKSIKIEKYVK